MKQEVKDLRHIWDVLGLLRPRYPFVVVSTSVTAPLWPPPTLAPPVWASWGSAPYLDSPQSFGCQIRWVLRFRRGATVRGVPRWTYGHGFCPLLVSNWLRWARFSQWNLSKGYITWCLIRKKPPPPNSVVWWVSNTKKARELKALVDLSLNRP